MKENDVNLWMDRKNSKNFFVLDSCYECETRTNEDEYEDTVVLKKQYSF